MTRQQEQPTGASRGTRMLTAFGETPEQISAELHKALERFQVALPECQGHWLSSPAPGRWSPAQVTEHVLMVNEVVAEIAAQLLSQTPRLPPPSGPGQVIGGKRVSPERLEPGPGAAWADLAGRWQTACERLNAVSARLQDADLSRRYAHPFLGEIDAHDWLRMATFHTRHHRRQLEE